MQGCLSLGLSTSFYCLGPGKAMKDGCLIPAPPAAAALHTLANWFTFTPFLLKRAIQAHPLSQSSSCPCQPGPTLLFPPLCDPDSSIDHLILSSFMSAAIWLAVSHLSFTHPCPQRAYWMNFGPQPPIPPNTGRKEPQGANYSSDSGKEEGRHTVLAGLQPGISASLHLTIS